MKIKGSVRRFGKHMIVAAVVVSLGLAAGVIFSDRTEQPAKADPVPVAQTKWDFAYTGNYQTWTVPESGYYKFEAWGAEAYPAGAFSGKGAYTQGVLSLTQGETIYIYVGQGNNSAGGGTSYNGSAGTSGGWPGGGATDFRLVANANWRDFNSLKSRIMIAAGGGAGSGTNTSQGGYGGALTGGKGVGVAGGGTQTAGGTGGGYTASGFGFGGGGCGGGG
ncbi:glycine rich domain-containing protein, partial [Candidatus Saccharibacteria bacterium]|nr:glycine rich domain-containing protein [Candidatus Saccharibacteria bacterium]